jgi:hypothetical protein
MAIDKAMIKRANARLARANAARAAMKGNRDIEDRGHVKRKRKMIEFYSYDFENLTFKGTMAIVDGVLKFDIEDKGFLFSVANGPPDVMNGDPEKYYDFAIGQRMMSSTIIMKEVEDKPQEGKPPTEVRKSIQPKRGNS